MRFAERTHLLTLLVRYIRYDNAVYTCFFAAGEEFLRTVGINRISVGQKYQRYLCFLAKLRYEVKNFIGSSACSQRTHIRFLDNLALSHGVGEGNAELYKSCAALNHGSHQLLGCSKIRIACGHKADKYLFLFVKCLLYSIHVNQLPYNVRLRQRPYHRGRKYL